MIEKEDRIYTIPDRPVNRLNALSIEKQDEVMDLLGGNLADKQIARQVGVAASTVSRIRKLHGLPVANYKRVQKEPECTPFWKKDEALILRLQGRSYKYIMEELGVGRNYINNHTSKYIRLSGVSLSKVGRKIISRHEAKRLLTDLRICHWRRSDELRDHINGLKKWKYAQRVWRCQKSI